MAGDDPEDRLASREAAQLVKAGEKLLVERIKADAAGDVIASFVRSATISIRRENRTIQEMTTETATAMVEMKRMEFAGARTRADTQIHTANDTTHSRAAVVVFFGILASQNLPFGATAIGLATVLSGSVLFSEFFNREKRKNQLGAPRN